MTLRRPRLPPHVEALAVAGEGAVLLTRAETRVLHGRLFERLIPLLDGRACESIAELLEAEVDPAVVFYAIGRLESEELLVEGGDLAPSEGPIPVPVIETTAGGELLVVADSYLDPGLAAINARQLASGEPWLLGRATGAAAWLGPRLVPGKTACWRCLEHRLRRNLPFEHLRLVAPDRLRRVHHRAGDVESLRVLLARESDLDGVLVTVDGGGTRHAETVPRRPQCPDCGDPGLQLRRSAAPVALRNQPARHAADGGWRTRPPEETVGRFERHVGALLGVVQAVRSGNPDDPAPVQRCVTRYGAAPGRGDGPLLEGGLRLAGGKGASRAQALASGLGEAIERYSCVFQGDEARRQASLASLGPEALHPNDCMLYSSTQYAERDERNRRAERLQWIPRRLEPDETLDWSPVFALDGGGRRWLPTMFLYGGYPADDSRAVCRFDPNGNAAGNTIEEAVLQGLLELVERDSLAIWWYNRLPRPAVDPAAFGLDWYPALARHYRSLGRELWALDITTDLGIPAFAALSRRSSGPSDAILMGFGAHLDARLAMSRAVTEMNQALVHVSESEAAGRSLESAMARWLDETALSGEPWLSPAAAAPAPWAEFRAEAGGLADAIAECRGRFAKTGLEAYVLDQTRPDIGVPVVKVVVPGLRHLRARLAPGRLYSVPVTMGWQTSATLEADMNPVPFFF